MDCDTGRTSSSAILYCRECRKKRAQNQPSNASRTRQWEMRVTKGPGRRWAEQTDGLSS